MKALALLMVLLLPVQALAAVPVIVINGVRCQLSSMYIDGLGNRIVVVNGCKVIKK